MKTSNPFPGMNPFLEVHWPDAHTRLITYVSDSISGVLPPDLKVLAEESVTIDGSNGPSLLRADIGIVEDDDVRLPDSIGSTTIASGTATKPERIRASRQFTHRWLEIRDSRENLVTVIEILSPANKTPDASTRFSRRQDRLLTAGVNIVDIDLIRSGSRTIPDDFDPYIKKPEGTTYLIVAGRAHDPEGREVYYCPMKERLPVISVPLRTTDEDIPLDLQPLVDRCYEAGRYWQASQRPLPPPELSTEEQQWANGLLTHAGLIG